MNRNIIRTSLAGMIAIALVGAACATTAMDIRKWGHAGNYDRIRAALNGTPPEDVRMAIATELGKGDYVFGIPDLVKLSKDSSPKVRMAGVEALGHYAGAEVYNAIIQRTGDENAQVARTAERILRTWGSETIEFLLEALSDRNYKVRAASTQVLGRMKKDKRIPRALLERAKQDDNVVVRREAVRGLGNLGYKPARKTLYKIKNTDSSNEVSLEAERALSKIGGKVTDMTVAVVPFRAAEKALEKVATEFHEQMSKHLVSSNLCNVMSGSELGDGDLKAKAIEAGKKLGAKQVITGSLERHQSSQVAVTIYRLNVDNGTMAQQEKMTGLESQSDKLVRDLVKRFISRFMQ